MFGRKGGGKKLPPDRRRMPKPPTIPTHSKGRRLTAKGQTGTPTTATMKCWGDYFWDKFPIPQEIRLDPEVLNILSDTEMTVYSQEFIVGEAEDMQVDAEAGKCRRKRMTVPEGRI